MFSYRRALGYFRPDLLPIGLLFLCTAGATLVGLLQAWPLAVLVDCVVMGAPASGWIPRLLLWPLPADRPLQIAGLALLTLVLRLLQEALGMGRTLLGHQVGYGGVLRVRADLYRKLQSLHLGYHHGQPQGESLYRLTSDAAAFQSLLQVLVTVVVSAGTLIVIVALMLSRSVALTGVALLVVPLLHLTNRRFERVLERRAAAAREAECALTTAAQQGLGQIQLVQAYGRQDDEFARFHRTLQGSAAAWLRLHAEEVRYFLTVGLILGGGAAAIFGYGGYLVYRAQVLHAQGGGGMSVGDLMILMTYLGLLYDPLCKLSGAGATLSGGVAGARRVLEVLDEPAAVREAEDALPLPVRPRTLRLKGVSFEYRPGRPVLLGADATIRAGEMVALVGPSGEGKSTILQLLGRFYDPAGGSIHLDEHDLRRVRLHDLRRHVALVPQDSPILPASIAENIAYGRPEASMAEIRRAAELAGAADFIAALPDGYATQVGDGNRCLSGGQKQRIAVARALLTEAPILALDEPTSALDADNERLLSETLARLKGHRTIVLVTHREAALQVCDRVLLLQGGRLIEASGAVAAAVDAEDTLRALGPQPLYAPLSAP